MQCPYCHVVIEQAIEYRESDLSASIVAICQGCAHVFIAQRLQARVLTEYEIEVAQQFLAEQQVETIVLECGHLVLVVMALPDQPLNVIPVVDPSLN